MTDGSSKYLYALIAVNVVVFAAVAVLSAFSPASAAAVMSQLSLVDSFASLASGPWTLITYAFVNGNVLQLIFNMIWFFAFGRLMLMRCSGTQLLAVYLAGAAAGAVAFILLFSLFDPTAEAILMGSSASVIAVATAVALIMPDTEIYLPLLGNTKIKWIVIVVIALFCIGLSAPNAGGNIAHIGGAAAGAIYALIFRHRSARAGSSDSSEYNRLVDKIKRTGYNSMTAKEKRRFFELSGRQ